MTIESSQKINIRENNGILFDKYLEKSRKILVIMKIDSKIYMIRL